MPLEAGELIFPKLEDAKRIHGELVSADFVHRSGQFRTEKGELMDFPLLDKPTFKHPGKDLKLESLPFGQRYRFHLF